MHWAVVYSLSLDLAADLMDYEEPCPLKRHVSSHVLGFVDWDVLANFKRMCTRPSVVRGSDSSPADRQCLNASFPGQTGPPVRDVLAAYLPG